MGSASETFQKWQIHILTICRTRLHSKYQQMDTIMREALPENTELKITI